MITLSSIKIVKEQRNIETNELHGYIVNDSIYIPLDNQLVKVIKQWQEAGNTITPAYTDEERLEYFKTKLLSSIQNLSDTKQKELQNYLAGKKVTDEQIQRYKTKYQLALKAKESGDYSAFELEAELNGVTAENLVDLIIQKAEEWQSEIDKTTLLIEAYRVKAQKEVESKFTDISQYDLFMKYIKKAKEFDLNVTEDEIKQLFTDFEAELSELNNA